MLGDLGQLVWDMLCFSTLLGMLEFFAFSVAHVLVEMSIIAVWLAVHVQFRKKVRTGVLLVDLPVILFVCLPDRL